jgi:hypothetical protein
MSDELRLIVVPIKEANDSIVSVPGVVARIVPPAVTRRLTARLEPVSETSPAVAEAFCAVSAPPACTDKLPVRASANISESAPNAVKLTSSPEAKTGPSAARSVATRMLPLNASKRTPPPEWIVGTVMPRAPSRFSGPPVVTLVPLTAPFAVTSASAPAFRVVKLIGPSATICTRLPAASDCARMPALLIVKLENAVAAEKVSAPVFRTILAPSGSLSKPPPLVCRAPRMALPVVVMRISSSTIAAPIVTLPTELTVRSFLTAIAPVERSPTVLESVTLPADAVRAPLWILPAAFAAMSLAVDWMEPVLSAAALANDQVSSRERARRRADLESADGRRVGNGNSGTVKVERLSR